jgi:hypothetical protein
MQQLRRHFLLQFGLSAAALSFGKVQAAARLVGVSPSQSVLGYSVFVKQVGHDFTATRASVPAVSLRLIEVDQLRSAAGYPDPATAFEQCYTLVFEAQSKTALREGVYTLGAKGVASFDAFVSPIRGDGRSYQVVFNRI